MVRASLLMPAALALGLAVSGGCRREVKFEPREFPGFSILLPSGTAVSRPTAEYRNGSIAISAGGDTVLSVVAWSPGTKLGTDELQLVLKGIGPVIERPVIGQITSAPGPGGKPVDTLHLTTDKIPMLISQIECGGRNMLIITGAQSGLDDVHQRVLASFSCKPDPAGEATLRDVHVDLQLDLPGWYSVSREEDQLQLSDGKSVLLLRSMPAEMSSRVAEAIAPVLAAAFNGTVTAEPDQDGRVVLHGTLDGEPLAGWARLIPCPRSKNLVLALAADQAAADALDATVAKATCLPPGAAPQRWPDAPATAPPPAASP